MTKKYFQLNDDIYIFHPDSHEVMRIDAQRIERLDHPEVIRTVRLKAMEITRQQAARVAPALDRLML